MSDEKKDEFKFFGSSKEEEPTRTESTEKSAEPQGEEEFKFVGSMPEEMSGRVTAPAAIPEVGAALGAVGEYKGWGSLLKPGAKTFAPDRAPVNPGYSTPIHPVNAPSGGIPDDLTDIEHMLQSGQDKRSTVTGRQMESGHNWETQRQSLATKQGLKSPGAAERIVEAGPQVATKSGISVPKHVGVQLENERLMREAKAAVAAQKAEAAAAKKAAAMGVAKGVGKVGLGALGGALSAKELYEGVTEMMRRGEIDARTASKLLSGAGGLAMMYPTVPTVVGGALAQIPALGYAAYDYFTGE